MDGHLEFKSETSRVTGGRTQVMLTAPLDDLAVIDPEQQNESVDLSGHIGVFLRFRPLNEREIESGDSFAWKFDETTTQSTSESFRGIFCFGTFY